MAADDRIRTLNLDSSLIMLFQTDCPTGHAKANRPCHLLSGATPLFCAARMAAAGVRPSGQSWMHTCQSLFDPYPVRILLPQRARCPKCGAVFIPIPGEIENPWRTSSGAP